MENEIEKWLPVVGLEGQYEVSNFGNVRGLDRYKRIKPSKRNPEGALRFYPGKLLRPGLSGNGYLTVALDRQSYCVQYLVASAFIGPKPDGKIVLHGDGVRTNNRWDNLRYGTHKENAQDMVLHGTKIIGSMARRSKITEKSASLIMAMRGRWSQSETAKIFGISPAAVQAVHDKRTWNHCKKITIESVLISALESDLDIWK